MDGVVFFPVSGRCLKPGCPEIDGTVAVEQRAGTGLPASTKRDHYPVGRFSGYRDYGLLLSGHDVAVRSAGDRSAAAVDAFGGHGG